jgi:hypothetical protein
LDGLVQSNWSLNMADKKISALTAASTPLAGTEVLPIVQSGATVKVAVSDLTAGRAVSASSLSSTTKVSGKIASSGSYNRIYEILALGGSAIGEISYNDTNDTMRIANLSNYVNTSTTLYVNGADRMEIMPNGDIKALNGNLVIGTSGKGIDFSATPGTGTSELLADYEEGDWTPTANGITFASAAGKYTKIGNVVVATFSVTFPTTVDANNAQISGLPFTVGTASAAAINGNLTITQLTPNVGATSMSFLTANNAAYSTNANLSTQPYTGVVSYRV